MNYTKFDQRRYPRVPIDNQITYALVDEQGDEMGRGLGRALNVSQGGILIQTSRPVTSKYIFLVCTDLRSNFIENIGKVVFSNENEDGTFNTGISFRGDHSDNVKFRKELIRLYHRQHVLKPNH